METRGWNGNSSVFEWKCPNLIREFFLSNVTLISHKIMWAKKEKVNSLSLLIFLPKLKMISLQSFPSIDFKSYVLDTLVEW